MDQEDCSRALPLFLQRWNFGLREISIFQRQHELRTYTLNLILIEVWNETDDNPGESTAKVDDFVHHEGHNARRKGVVLNVSIPCSP